MNISLPGGQNVEIQENLVDRIVRYFDPMRGQARLRSRFAFALANGGYVGASRTKRSLKRWNPAANDPDTDTLIDLPTLRSRSRDLVRNTPIATGAINTNCTSVVGTGLKLQSRIDREALNLTEEAADAWEAQAEREWRLWADSQECDLARMLDFTGIQRLAFRSALESGDVFALLPFIKRTGSPYGLKVQLVEADRICNEGNAADSEILAGGVVRDSYGAPIAYHILRQHPGRFLGSVSQGFKWDVVPAFGERTGRRNVLHLCEILRPGQSRGVPYLSPVIDSLRQLGEYTDSELMAALVASLFTVFVNTPGGKSLAPFAPSEETGGTSTDEDYKLRSGAMVELAPGESIQTADPGRPNAAFDPFVVSVLRQVGVALEIPFEVLVKHFTASYSAARAALLEAWRFFSVRRQWLSRMLCQPVYEAFMDEVVAIGRIGAPGYFSDPIIRKAYLGSIWIGDAAGQIDPLKEVKAAESRLALRISTISEETAGITGGDFEKNVAQIAKERRMLRQVGINPDPAPKVGAPGNGDFPKHPEEEDTQDQLEKEELS